MSVARRISWKVVFQHTGVSNIVSNSKLALLCSLLTSSSFHLRGCGQFDSADAVARYFRSKAMKYLRLALSSGYTAVGSSANSASMVQSIPNPESVLSVILTLVTADVMDGQMTEFWIHLDAAQALVTRLKDKHQAPPGSPAEHLINIYTFLRIMSDSTDVSTPLSPGSLQIGKSSAFLRGAHSLEFTYGITARLADLLRRTSRLAQARRYYRGSNQPESTEFLSARDGLFRDLMDWDISQEALPSFPASDDITTLLASTHIQAFAAGIRVYFHARVLPCDEAEMQSLVQSVASHLTSIETIKRRTGYDATPTAAISWPGFIASCQASPPNRDVWSKWWIQMQDYHIGNLDTLWSVVQEIWSWQDPGVHDDAPWTLILEHTGRRILAI